MVRPCYLVVDPEHGGSISTRKLVIETAKLNVITAYSSTEAIETLRKFPALDGIVLDAAMRDMPCGEMIKALRAVSPNTPILIVGSPQAWNCAGADAYVESFSPVNLLQRLSEMQKTVVDEIANRDAALSAAGA